MNLHQQFVKLGKQRHQLRNQLLALLPKIYESGIYKKYAETIVEYAGKFGDIPASTVHRRLELEKTLEKKPHLKAAIKTVGINKVAMVAKIATVKNEKALADKVMHMSKKAVQPLSKELRGKPVAKTVTIELDAEMATQFLKLKKKLGKQLSNKSVMKQLLKKMMKQEFPQKKQKRILTGQKKVTRYISAVKKHQTLEKYKNCCAYPGCNQTPKVFHHTTRFAQKKSHDSVVPLCDNHHQFAHNGLIENEEQHPQNWELNLNTSVINPVDLLYRSYS